MKLKISSKESLFIVSTLGIILSMTIIFFTWDLPVQGSYAKPIVKTIQNTIIKEPISAGLPVRLKIPKIKVNTALESVGLTPQGAVGTPKGPINAAWFNLGPHPGDIGSSIITGHYGVWKNGIATVFNNLYKLQKGDKLYVVDDKGVAITFVVREIRSYDPNAGAVEVFGSDDNKSHLNLITCEGIWNKVSKSYSKRLVVFTDRVDE